MGLLNFPPYWGYLVWNMDHDGAEIWEQLPTGEWTDQVCEAWSTYLVLRCRYLPCPFCRGHCVSNTAQQPPGNWPQATDLVKYLIGFHNQVNKQTGKLEWSEEEARQALKDRWTATKRTVSMLPIDSFIVIDIYARSAVWVRTQDDEARTDLNEEEQKHWLDLMLAMAYVLPFSGQNSRLRSIWTEYWSRADLTSVPRLLEHIRTLYNVLLKELSLPTLTVQEFDQFWNQRFEFHYLTQLSQAHQKRMEDHKKMQALIRDNEQYKAAFQKEIDLSSGVSSDSNGTAATNNKTARAITGGGTSLGFEYALMAVLLVLIVVMLCALYVFVKYYRQCDRRSASLDVRAPILIKG